jgi:hypothetical protein
VNRQRRVLTPMLKIKGHNMPTYFLRKNKFGSKETATCD